MKIGVRLESLNLPLRPALNEASKMGAAGVQVDAAGDLAPDALTKTGRREFRNLLRSLNLDLTALGCPLRRGLDVAENQQPRIEHVRKVMALAFDLGPRIAIVETPSIPDEPKEEAPPPAFSGGLLLGSAPLAAHPAKVLRESLTDLGAHGDRTGTTLALETGLDPADKLAAYLDTFATGALGVNYDPANMLLNGFDPIRSLTPLHSKIVHTHARDARRGSAGRTGTEVALGAGDVDWFTYVAVLDSIEYRGWLVVERTAGDSPVADAANGISQLRKFVR
jgi:sugar phosphate isomerase/epimerase